MRPFLDILQIWEFEDDGLHEFLLELADLEAIVADDIQVSDSEETMDDVLLLALFAENKEWLVGLDEDCKPLSDLATGRKPIRTSDYSSIISEVP